MNKHLFHSGLSKKELSYYLIVLFAYLMFIKGSLLGAVLMVFAPLFMLKFIDQNRQKLLPYIVMIVILILGSLMVSEAATILFIFLTILPSTVIFFLHMKENANIQKDPNIARNQSALAMILGPLPIFITIIALYKFYPDFMLTISESIKFMINDTYKSLLETGSYQKDMQEMMKNILDNQNEIADYFVVMLPSLLYTSVMTIIYFTERYHYRYNVMDITRVPDIFLWVLVLSQIAMVVSSISDLNLSVPSSYLHNIGVNGITISGSLFFFRGLDVLRYNMHKLKAKTIIRAIIYFMIFTQYILVILLVILGLVSTFKNLTKNIKNDKQV